MHVPVEATPPPMKKSFFLFFLWLCNQCCYFVGNSGWPALMGMYPPGHPTRLSSNCFVMIMYLWLWRINSLSLSLSLSLCLWLLACWYLLLIARLDWSVVIYMFRWQRHGRRLVSWSWERPSRATKHTKSTCRTCCVATPAPSGDYSTSTEHTFISAATRDIWPATCTGHWSTFSASKLDLLTTPLTSIWPCWRLQAGTRRMSGSRDALGGTATRYCRIRWIMVVCLSVSPSLWVTCCFRRHYWLLRLTLT